MKFKDTQYGDLSGKVYDGDIDVVGLGLTSLEGSPKIVNGDFNCRWNRLKTLEFSPSVVNGHFDCSENELHSLDFSPNEVNGDFDCNCNFISSPFGLPLNIKSLNIEHNDVATFYDRFGLNIMIYWKGNPISDDEYEYLSNSKFRY